MALDFDEIYKKNSTPNDTKKNYSSRYLKMESAKSKDLFHWKISGTRISPESNTKASIKSAKLNKSMLNMDLCQP